MNAFKYALGECLGEKELDSTQPRFQGSRAPGPPENEGVPSCVYPTHAFLLHFFRSG